MISLAFILLGASTISFYIVAVRSIRRERDANIRAIEAERAVKELESYIAEYRACVRGQRDADNRKIQTKVPSISKKYEPPQNHRSR